METYNTPHAQHTQHTRTGEADFTCPWVKRVPLSLVMSSFQPSFSGLRVTFSTLSQQTESELFFSIIVIVAGLRVTLSSTLNQDRGHWHDAWHAKKSSLSVCRDLRPRTLSFSGFGAKSSPDSSCVVCAESETTHAHRMIKVISSSPANNDAAGKMLHRFLERERITQEREQVNH